MQVTPGWCLSPLQTLATNDLVILPPPCAGREVIGGFFFDPPPQCLVRAVGAHHQSVPGLGAAAGHPNLPRSREKAAWKNGMERPWNLSSGRVGSKGLEARAQPIDSLLQLVKSLPGRASRLPDKGDQSGGLEELKAWNSAPPGSWADRNLTISHLLTQSCLGTWLLAATVQLLIQEGVDAGFCPEPVIKPYLLGVS